MVPERHPAAGRRLRVAVVAPTHRILGGHSVQAANMLHGWTRDPDVEAWLVPINPLPPSVLRRLLEVKYLRTLITQACYWPLLFRELHGADVAHVFSASSSGFVLSTVPAVLVARMLGVPVLLNYHSGDAPQHLSHSRLARLVLRHLVTTIVVPSRFLREVFGRFHLRAEVVPNSIDVQRFSYRPRTPLLPRLLSTRNLEPLYNVGCTLRAFARVQHRHPQATLTIIGTGSDEEALRTLVTELGLHGVTFRGRVAPHDMPDAYAAADIYVQTPSVDNMPVSVLEAFASGLPVVSTRVGGVPAMLTDGLHGLLAEDDDDTAVADRILRLLEDADHARALAAAARESCGPCEWAQVREGWLAVYRQTVLRTTPDDAIPIEVA